MAQTRPRAPKLRGGFGFLPCLAAAGGKGTATREGQSLARKPMALAMDAGGGGAGVVRRETLTRRSRLVQPGKDPDRFLHERWSGEDRGRGQAGRTNTADTARWEKGQFVRLRPWETC